MPDLMLRHCGSDAENVQFRIERASDGKHGPSVTIPDPASLQVEGRTGTDLAADLTWYLEHFLDYPFEPNTDVAERVQRALNDWGEKAYSALFTGPAAIWFHEAYKKGLEHLTLRIASDDPRVLGWPWEALADPQVGPLAHRCRIERQLNELRDPLPIPESLPRDRLRILMITARPHEADVGFRTLSRPILDLVARERLPVEIDLLRPPTFGALRARLSDRPGHYHLVHFDGHGGFGAASASSPNCFGATEGLLVFEDDQGEPNSVHASTLATLLQEHRIPVMVLNACQSAMIDERAEDAFASVAGALQKAGINSVLAMSHSLYVSAAEVFIPAFYAQLFQSGDMGQAVRAGRQALLQTPERLCVRGRFPLKDWLVPVLYQQSPPSLAFAESIDPETLHTQVSIPDEARDQRDMPYGFIGRDSAILAIERAMRRPPAAILVHGLGGIGKTTLARGLVQWLAATDGLEAGCRWFAFQDIRYADSVFNPLVAELFGTNAQAAPEEQKQKALIAHLREQPWLLVWDNLESATAGDGVSSAMAIEERNRLLDFLRRLRGGKTKVLITSRRDERDWLGPTDGYRVPLGGLEGEERWSLTEAIVHDLGLKVDRSDEALASLLESLEGHPLLMRAVLVQLEHTTATNLEKRLREGFDPDAQDPTLGRLRGTLDLVTEQLSDEQRALLVPLALHERFVDADYLAAMATKDQPNFERTAIDPLFVRLESAGLVHNQGQNIFALHPALTGYLRALTENDPARAQWEPSFMDVMGRLANALTPRPLQKQRAAYHWHGANFLVALEIAERQPSAQDIATLAQCFGAYAQNRWDLTAAEQWYRRLYDTVLEMDNEMIVAGAAHQLGIIAQMRHNLDTAEQWYQRSLEIEERLGNEAGIALTAHHLGIVAQMRHDLDTAEQWYQRSLEMNERLGNKTGIASTAHHLGIVAQERHDLDTAEQWYQRSLEIEERLGNEAGIALTAHQLGIIAELRHDLDTAEQWYQRSLEISERLGIETGIASTAHQLGRIAQERHDLDTAEQWHQRSLEISERLGNEAGIALSAHQLGMIAQERRDLDTAEQWYQRSLASEQAIGNARGAATSLRVIGGLRLAQDRPTDAAAAFLDAGVHSRQGNDEQSVANAATQFIEACSRCPQDAQASLRVQWTEAGLAELPEPAAAQS